MLADKCVHNKAPEYLKDLLKDGVPIRSGLCSEKDNKLVIPYTERKTFVQKSFSVQGLTKWNSLPLNIRSEEDTETFKCLLKTHLFKWALHV